jgi:phosphoserine phosphatase RsbU/P
MSTLTADKLKEKSLDEKASLLLRMPASAGKESMRVQEGDREENFKAAVQKSWKKEKKALMLKYNNLGTIIALLFYPFWYLLDYFLAPDNLKLEFGIERGLASVLMLIALVFTNKFKWREEIPAYSVLLLIGLHISYMCSQVPVSDLSAYMLQYCTLFICAGMILLWDLRHSIIVVTNAVLSFVAFNLWAKNHPLDTILTQGGLLILTVLVVYIVLKSTRMNLHKKEYISRFSLNSALNELQEKNKIISENSSKITNSINYAKRIQEAILPKEDALANTFDSHFIYFQPRDIVSGDFYWFAEKDDKYFVSVADCTGHGVPGALMSMIGIELLNKIVFLQDIQSPDEILNELHKQIRKTLKQDITENRDGMDIALCVIDKDQKAIEFAGAKNPLIYIHKGEFQRIKGDKVPIGGVQKEKERLFTKHVLPFDEDTTVYMFSDGYQDQFGGEDGKKFLSKRFLQLLEYVSKEPMNKQKSILDITIQDWMGASHKQVDDILVMGLKG